MFPPSPPPIHPSVNECLSFNKHTDKGEPFRFDHGQILHATIEHATLISGGVDLPIGAALPSHQAVFDRVGGSPSISQAKKKNFPQTLDPEPKSGRPARMPWSCAWLLLPLPCCAGAGGVVSLSLALTVPSPQSVASTNVVRVVACLPAHFLPPLLSVCTTLLPFCPLLPFRLTISSAVAPSDYLTSGLARV